MYDAQIAHFCRAIAHRRAVPRSRRGGPRHHRRDRSLLREDGGVTTTHSAARSSRAPTDSSARAMVERLLRRRVPARALVRQRLARGPGPPGVERVHGDVTRPDSLRAAVAGCDVVFHCAWGGESLDDARRVNVEGTRNVLEAAAASRRTARRAPEHHGRARRRACRPSSPRTLPLDHRRRRLRRQQGRGRAAWPSSSAARAASRWSRCVRRWSTARPRPYWVVGYCERVKREEVALVDGGTGLANLIFVEDLVDAMWAAAEAPGRRRRGVPGLGRAARSPGPSTWATSPACAASRCRRRCRSGAPSSRCRSCASTARSPSGRAACRAWTSA